MSLSPLRSHTPPVQHFTP